MMYYCDVFIYIPQRCSSVTGPFDPDGFEIIHQDSATKQA